MTEQRPTLPADQSPGYRFAYFHSHVMAEPGMQWVAPNHQSGDGPDLPCACGNGYLVSTHEHYHALSARVCHNINRCVPL